MSTATAGLVTVDELAKVLKIQPRTVRRWAKLGKIPALKISARALRFDVADVMQALRPAGSRKG